MKEFIKKSKFIPLFLFFALMLIKGFCTGYNYLPLLDDHIQYKVFSDMANPFYDAVIPLSLLNARPFAGITDIYFWSMFWNKLNTAFFIITFIYTLACLLLYQIFSKYFKCGYLFLIIIGFSPIISEGTIWLSASTRIVIGLFFASLSAFLLQLYIKTKNRLWLNLFFLPCILSFGFYEQTAIISICLCIIILIFERGKYPIYVASFPFLCAIPTALFYLFGSTGGDIFTNRMSFISFNENLGSHLISVLLQIFNIFIPVNLKLTCSAFSLGFSSANLLFLIGIVPICSLIGYFCSTKKKLMPNGEEFKAIIFGLLLFLAPLSLFFILKGSVITLRNALCPLIGIGLAADGLMRIIFHNTRTLYSLMVFSLLFFFTVGYAGECVSYYKVGEKDSVMIDAVYEQTKQFKKGDKVAVLNLPPYYENTGEQFHEHIYSAASSQWALTGAMYAKNKSKDFCSVYPLDTNSAVPYGMDDFLMYTAVFAYENNQIIQLYPISGSGYDIEFYDNCSNHYITAKRSENGYFFE